MYAIELRSVTFLSPVLLRRAGHALHQVTIAAIAGISTIGIALGFAGAGSADDTLFEIAAACAARCIGLIS